MKDAVLAFADQFAYKPKIENAKALKKKKKFIVLGMGGSHLAADLALTYNPSLPLRVHSDYGLPAMSKKELKEHLIIASSYSGNTEEVVEGLKQALKMKLDVAVICVGGKLLALAKKHGLAYVQMPDTGIQPRSALGFSMLGTLKLMGETKAIKEAAALAASLDPKKLEAKGKGLAKKFKDRVPVIYCSNRNKAIAYNWKIKFNETGKIPAFYNVFPELNHNEMTGFDAKPKSKHLSKGFYFLFLKDAKDHRQIQKRMNVIEKLYKKRGLKVDTMDLSGKSSMEKIFTSLVIGDWAAIHTANLYNLESEQVPMVEEFKKLIK